MARKNLTREEAEADQLYSEYQALLCKLDVSPGGYWRRIVPDDAGPVDESDECHDCGEDTCVCP